MEPGGHDPDDDPLRRAIDELTDLPPGGQTYLRDRWLDQLEWFERKAGSNQRRYKQYRTVAIAGGVLLPVLINLATTRSDEVFDTLAIVVSILVGLAAGLESFLRPDERWLRYRQTAEQLRAEWWLFVNLAGPDYGRYDSTRAAFTHFVERTESMIGEDVAGFVAIVKAASSSGNPDEDGADSPG
jgi:hypothetical protein